jgi:hypothetical protein
VFLTELASSIPPPPLLSFSLNTSEESPWKPTQCTYTWGGPIQDTLPIRSARTHAHTHTHIHTYTHTCTHAHTHTCTHAHTHTSNGPGMMGTAPAATAEAAAAKQKKRQQQRRRENNNGTLSTAAGAPWRPPHHYTVAPTPAARLGHKGLQKRRRGKGLRMGTDGVKAVIMRTYELC